MTAINYPDCFATSPTGRFRFEAQSPDNGPDPEAGGRTIADERSTFGGFQSDFRYRLIDNATAAVVWERRQSRRQDSPRELVVSDEGWSVTRTHGYAPEVVARTPKGRVAIRVVVIGPKDDNPDVNDDTRPSPRPRKPTGRRRFVWRAQGLGWTSAGKYWAEHSCPYFFDFDRRPHFAWRTSGGQRLLLDLEGGRVIEDGGAAGPSLAAACDAEECRWARQRLAELAPTAASVAAEIDRADKDEDYETQSRLYFEHIEPGRVAAHLAIAHRLVDCVPLLRELEPVELGGSCTSCEALGGGHWVESQVLRPIVHHALRVLGAEPRGYATYAFELNGQRVPMPGIVGDLASRLGALHRWMSARAVIEQLGSPHYVGRSSGGEGENRHRTEEWEYDVLTPAGWTTTKIVWREKENDEDGPAGIVSIESSPSEWLRNEERLSDILRF